MLGAGPGNADNIRLLKGIIADEHGGHLPGEDNDGNGVHIGRSNTGHGIGCAGTRGHQAHAHITGGAGIAVCGMHCCLLMAHQDVLQLGLVEIIVDVKH